MLLSQHFHYGVGRHCCSCCYSGSSYFSHCWCNEIYTQITHTIWTTSWYYNKVWSVGMIFFLFHLQFPFSFSLFFIIIIIIYIYILFHFLFYYSHFISYTCVPFFNKIFSVFVCSFSCLPAFHINHKYVKNNCNWIVVHFFFYLFCFFHCISNSSILDMIFFLIYLCIDIIIIIIYPRFVGIKFNIIVTASYYCLEKKIWNFLRICVFFLFF